MGRKKPKLECTICKKEFNIDCPLEEIFNHLNSHKELSSFEKQLLKVSIKIMRGNNLGLTGEAILGKK